MKKKRKPKVVKTRPEKRLAPWGHPKCPKCGSKRTYESHAGRAVEFGCHDCSWKKRR